MLNRLILKVTKFQLPPPKRLGTVVKNILGAPPMSNRVKTYHVCLEIYESTERILERSRDKSEQVGTLFFELLNSKAETRDLIG